MSRMSPLPRFEFIFKPSRPPAMSPNLVLSQQTSRCLNVVARRHITTPQTRFLDFSLGFVDMISHVCTRPVTSLPSAALAVLKWRVGGTICASCGILHRMLEVICSTWSLARFLGSVNGFKPTCEAECHPPTTAVKCFEGALHHTMPLRTSGRPGRSAACPEYVSASIAGCCADLCAGLQLCRHQRISGNYVRWPACSQAELITNNTVTQRSNSSLCA